MGGATSMSKDNREELKCCGNCDHPEDSGDYCPYAGTNVFKHHICGNWKQYKPLNMDLRSKLGEVTIDSGADVKQDVLDLKICLSTISGYHPDNYATQLLLTKAMKLIDKLNPITIKGE